MSQAYKILDENDGTSQTIADVSDSLEAMRSNFSSTGPPSDPAPVEGQFFFHQTNKTLYQYADSAWRPIAQYTVMSDEVGTYTTTGVIEEGLVAADVPAGYIQADGNGVEIEAWFLTAANANRKRGRIKFGATTVADSGEVTLNNKLLRLTARIIRTSATTQIAAGRASNVDPPEEVYSAPAETLASAVSALITGLTADNAGDMTCIFFAVRSILGHSG
jgi:hypothetical protein